MELKKLKDPFPIEKIRWRTGARSKDKKKGIGLAYIDARDLYERLDEVCGPENWQLRYSHAASKTVCDIGIKIDGEWVWKANGAGDTQIEADKGALSDAAKRAGVPWGIAAYLYDMPNVWVHLDDYGNIKKDQIEILKNELLKLTGDKLEVGTSREWLASAKEEIENIEALEKVSEWFNNNIARINKLSEKQQKWINGIGAAQRAKIEEQASGS